MKWPGLTLADQMTRAAKTAQPLTPPPAWRAIVAPGMKVPAPQGAREVLDLLKGWTFIALGGDGSRQEPQPLSVPHRWRGDRDFAEGWYLMRLPLQRREGERLFARFEQVTLFCVLFVKGVECGRHLGSFTPFEFDMTEAV